MHRAGGRARFASTGSFRWPFPSVRRPAQSSVCPARVSEGALEVSRETSSSRFRSSLIGFFRREGSDIHVTVPINVAQATLGSKICVRTVGGRHVVLKIPPGTQSGTKFRIREQGVSKNGRKGDQLVEVKVEVPAALSDEGLARMREFAEASNLRY